MDLFPFHPCKKCLVRPSCNEICKKLTLYKSIFIPTIISLLSSVGIILFILSWIFITKWIFIIYLITINTIIAFAVLCEKAKFSEILIIVISGNILFTLGCGIFPYVLLEEKFKMGTKIYKYIQENDNA